MQRIRYSRYFKTAIIILDLIIVASVFIYFFLIRNAMDFTKTKEQINLLSLLLISLFWLLLSGRTKLYNIPRNLTFTMYLERVVTHLFIYVTGIVLLSMVSRNEFLQYEKFRVSFVLFITIIWIKSFIFFALKYFRANGGNYRNAMFLEENSSSLVLKNTLKARKDYGYQLYDYPEKKINISHIISFWKEHGIHTVFIPSENNLEKELERKILQEAENNQVKITLIPSISKNDFYEYDLGYIETQPILFSAKFPLNYYTNALIKRLFDVIFSILVLTLIGIWLFPILALLIKLDSPGSVFFKQKRYGFHDEVFQCIKFRTMVVNQESASKTTCVNDSRITKIGRLLRKTSLDEMPQFINVLYGEMSVIGPRPHMLLVDDYYKERIGKYTIRSKVKPGITGLAQVSGFRGDSGNMELEMKKRILADSFYVKNWSLTLDLIIILKTVYLLLKGDKKAI